MLRTPDSQFSFTTAWLFSFICGIVFEVRICVIVAHRDDLIHMKKICIALVILAIFTILLIVYIMFWKQMLTIVLSVAGCAIVLVLGNTKDGSNQTCQDLVSVDTGGYSKTLVVLLAPVWLVLCWVAVIIDILGMMYRCVLPTPPRRWIIVPM
jgi:glucan phosphoethanolaminetransferase (alkaline phosphatase superfamily)